MGSWMVIVVLLTQVIFLALSKQMTCDIFFNQKRHGLVVNCSRRGLTFVPQDLPVNIVGLDLYGNHMKGNLTNGVFASYSSLIFLVLSYNKFDHLEKDAFVGLHNLSQLELAFTTFLDNGSYPPAILDPLKNLKTLNIVGPIRDGVTFPCFIFLPLRKLTDLSIVAFCFPTKEPEPELKNMNNLKKTCWPNLEECRELKNMINLKFLFCGSLLSAVALKNDTFIFLEFVPIQNLTVGGILNLTEDCVFCPLKHLLYLKIENPFFSDLTLHDVTRFLYGLANRSYTINVIDLSQVQGEHCDIILDRQVIGNLPEICVKRLDLSGNRLMAVRSDTFKKSDIFTKCVEYLDLSRNFISFDICFHFQMHFMINLTLLDLSQNAIRFPPSGDICPAGCLQFEDRKKLMVGAVSGYNISLPPKLEYLNLSKTFNYILLLGDVTFSNGNNLRILDLSNNNNIVMNKYNHVKGLSSISYLDISGMEIDEITFTYSDLFTVVKILIARKSNIFPKSLMSKDSVFFVVMTNLTQLDLSENSFRVINERTFSRLINVVNFSLSGNQLSCIPEEVLIMPSLTSLDLSYNSINIIKKEERELLDKKVEQQGRVYLNIFGNSITCTCNTLDFVKWLHETRITLGNKGNYSCLTDSGAMMFTTQVYNDLMLFWRRCVGQFWLTVAVSLQLFLIICLMSAFLMKKYFPKIEHHILQLLGYKGKVAPKRCDFTYDAYVCYEDKRYQWPCLCLYQKLLQIDKRIKLYLPDLHETPGYSKADATIDAISKSWKLIIVVTEDLFTDEWSYFTVLTAVRLFSQEEMITSRILLLYQDISPQAKARVPRLLLNVVPEENILEVKSGDDDFWAELHQMISSEDLDVNVLF